MKYIRNIIIVISILAIGLILFFSFTKKTKLYTSNLFYMDTYIEVRLYSNNKEKAESALKEVDKIYKTYHQLSDRYNAYDHLINVYNLNQHNYDTETLEVDSKLYKLLEFGLKQKTDSNDLLDINMGCVIDVWKNYRDNKNGIPTEEELNNCTTNELKLLGNNKVLNNTPDIDLGAVAKGYATEEVGRYLKSIGLTKFLINAGGNILVGDHYENSKYKVGVENPNDGSVYKVLKVNNKAVVTSGGYERYYTYDNKKYHHIISPFTKYPTNYMKSVTVIADDSAVADALSTILFLMPIEDGKEFIKKYDAQVIWYNNDNQIITTEGISNYE